MKQEPNVCLTENMDKEARLLCHAITERLDKLEGQIKRLRAEVRNKGKKNDARAKAKPSR